MQIVQHADAGHHDTVAGAVQTGPVPAGSSPPGEDARTEAVHTSRTCTKYSGILRRWMAGKLASSYIQTV